MSTTTVDQEVRSYLEQVTQHLSELPDEDRRELLEDLEEHLLEVAAEDGGSLIERLGPPQDYAVELCVAAGLAVPSPASYRSRLKDRITASAFGRAAAVLGETKIARSEFWGQLRPGWWVLRGWVITAVSIYSANELGSRRSPLSPNVSGNFLLGALIVAGGVVASVWLGRRSRHGPLRLLGLASSIVAAIMLIGVLAERREAYASYGPSWSPYLTDDDAHYITNICAYTPDGKPLERVLLFDQSGQPIDNVYDEAGEDGYEVRLEGSGDDGEVTHPEEAAPEERDTARFSNAYPRPQVLRDRDSGELVPFTCPDIVISPDRAAQDDED